MDNLSEALKQAVELAIRRYLGNAQWWTVTEIIFMLRRDAISLSDNAIIELLRGMVARQRLIHRVSVSRNTKQQYLEYHLPDNLEETTVNGKV